jgi:ABC-type nitrate/sulfonate/bicarbonate transport system substrate-binding protein
MTFANCRLGMLKLIFISFGFVLTFLNQTYAGPLVVGYSSVTSVFLPFWIGNDAGFYKKEGLDSQLIYIASSTTMAQAMFARQIAISTVNSGSVVSSGLQGGDLVLMGAVINTAAFYIIARPEISGVQDLKGKRIGITRLGSSSDFAMREYLKKNQLQIGRDVNLTQAGRMPELAAALNSGVRSALRLFRRRAPTWLNSGVIGSLRIWRTKEFTLSSPASRRHGAFCANSEATPRLFCAGSVARHTSCSSSETRQKLS